MMAYRLACELSPTVAAIAVVAGNMATASGSLDVPCHPARAVSVLAIHGTADPRVPFAGGGLPTDRVVYAPFNSVIERWRQLDGCSSSETMSTHGSVMKSTWECADGSEVSTLVIEGGGHDWPGSPFDRNAAAAPITVSEVIADFFQKHQP
jgi:polyhydroxybutyrate depolymerase